MAITSWRSSAGRQGAPFGRGRPGYRPSPAGGRLLRRPRLSLAVVARQPVAGVLLAALPGGPPGGH